MYNSKRLESSTYTDQRAYNVQGVRLKNPKNVLDELLKSLKYCKCTPQNNILQVLLETFIMFYMYCSKRSEFSTCTAQNA